ncbi:hypothetical protein SVAN01_02060 [Stagonosporopsis vannaccii]|nr:hypothetical protein SVAN01_02060 [Stagonosporopsis vannaccii]
MQPSNSCAGRDSLRLRKQAQRAHRLIQTGVFTIQCMGKRLPAGIAAANLGCTCSSSKHLSFHCGIVFLHHTRSLDRAISHVGSRIKPSKPSATANTRTLMCKLQRTTATRFDLPEPPMPSHDRALTDRPVAELVLRNCILTMR